MAVGLRRRGRLDGGAGIRADLVAQDGQARPRGRAVQQVRAPAAATAAGAFITVLASPNASDAPNPVDGLVGGRAVDGRGVRRQGRAGHRDHPRGDQRKRRGAGQDGAVGHAAHPVPLTAKLVGELSLLVYVPVKPMVTDPPGAMRRVVRLVGRGHVLPGLGVRRRPHAGDLLVAGERPGQRPRAERAAPGVGQHDLRLEAARPGVGQRVRRRAGHRRRAAGRRRRAVHRPRAAGTGSMPAATVSAR